MKASVAQAVKLLTRQNCWPLQSRIDSFAFPGLRNGQYQLRCARGRIAMKIHFLLAKDFFRGGGIETYTREAGRRLAARGHEVTVYSTRGQGACPEEWEGMRFVWLPRIRPH